MDGQHEVVGHLLLSIAAATDNTYPICATLTPYLLVPAFNGWMKYLVYGENRVLTGDAIAEAVLAYAAALGENSTTDIVEVPTCDEDGGAAVASVLLGPASQVMVEFAPDDELEPEDDDLVNELQRRTAEVGGSRFVDAASSHSDDPAAKKLRTAPPSPTTT
jgi:cytosine/adenosine deaminase-related metal-dependent hydrolase